MTSTCKPRTRLLMLLLTGILVLHGSLFSETISTGISNEPALRVNSEIISLRELESVFSDSVQLLMETSRRDKIDQAEIAKRLQEAWNSSIQTIIQDALLDQLGRQKRREIIARVVETFAPGTSDRGRLERFERIEADAIRKLKKEKIDSAGGEKELQEALNRKGTSMRQWEDSIRRELFRRYALSQSLGVITFSPGAAREYYESHRDQFRVPDAWRIRRIRIPFDRFKSVEVAKSAADMIYEKIKSGSDFVQLAAALDYDPQYGPQGGLLTVNGKPDFPSGLFPAEELIARDFKNGEVSPPVKSKDAYLIVKREFYKEGKDPPYAEVMDRVAALSFNEHIRMKKREFFQAQKDSAFVEVLIKSPPERWLELFK